MSAPIELAAWQAARVRCDGCGTERQDIAAATEEPGNGCPRGCHAGNTPVYWPNEGGPGWHRDDG